MNQSATTYDPCHVGQESVSAVGGPLQIVEKNLPSYLRMLNERPGIAALVVHRGVMTIILSWMSFTGIDEYRAHGPIGKLLGKPVHRLRRQRAKRSGE